MKLLKDFVEKNKSGYAHDLSISILNGDEANELAADSLFRTLVLDENIDVDTAEKMYEEAVNLIEGRNIVEYSKMNS